MRLSKTATAEYHREWYAKNKDRRKAQIKAYQQRTLTKFKEYKHTLKCVRCGEAETACLDFHHTDPNTKEFNVSQMRRTSFENIMKEANKCIILCANCHRKEHMVLVA